MKFLRFAALVASAALSTATASADVDVRPDSLLAVDTHREAIVEKTIAAWPGGVSGEQAETLRRTLWGLRADRLLAVSLTPGMPGLLDVMATADRADDTAASHRVSTKALGDFGADLTYTPLTPCRIADTRNAGGALAANNTRQFVGWTNTTFAAQGGAASDCGIPTATPALAINVYAVNPTNLGFIKLWPAGLAEPNVSTVNYEPPTVAIATGTILPVNFASSNAFWAKSPVQVHMVVDVVGYFRNPTTGYVKQVSVGPGMTVNGQTSVNGVNNINLQLLPTQVLPTSPCSANQIPKWNGAAWLCANEGGVISDRAAKENFAVVDTTYVLERLLAVPISAWNYRTQDASIRHIGPMAQDVHAAFGIGESDRTINAVDAQGIAFAAIQGLNAKVEQAQGARDADVAAQRAEIARLRDEIARQRAELAEFRSTQADVAALRAAMTELLRERSSGVTRTRLVP
jgi:hypothetical protein